MFFLIFFFILPNDIYLYGYAYDYVIGGFIPNFWMIPNPE